MNSGVLFRYALSVVASVLLVPTAWSMERMKMYVGPERDIQPQIGREFAKVVGRAAGINVEVVPTDGPGESMQRMRDAAGPSLALLPSDLSHAYRDAAVRGHADADLIFAPVSVIAPLYEEVFYFVVRRDSPLNSIGDIKDARINVGPIKSDAAVSVSTLFGLLFDRPLADGNVSFLSHEEALVKLITDRSVDVVAMVAAQPTRLLADMKPEARRFVKLLKFEPSQLNGEATLRVFGAATIRSTSYPNLLDEDLATVSHRLYLVVYGHRHRDYDDRVTRLVRSWCENANLLQADGHPQWRNIAISASDLGAGWHYAQTAWRELSRCAGMPTEVPVLSCPLRERVLGLCD